MARDMGRDVSWFAVNVGDGHSWDDWLAIRSTAQANGVTVYPWQRCHDETYLRHLLAVAAAAGVQPLPNLEKELENVLSPSRVRQVCSEYPVDVVGWSFVGWLYNSVDFTPLADKPGLLQLFPADMRFDPAIAEQVQTACVSHARALGLVYVGITFQTYAGAQPSWYAYHQGTRSYFTADDIGAGKWPNWRPA